MDGRPSIASDDDGADAGLTGRVVGGAGRAVELASTLPVDELAGRDRDMLVGQSHVAIDVSALATGGSDENVPAGEGASPWPSLARPSGDGGGRQSLGSGSRQSHQRRDARGAAPRYINKSLVKHAEDMTEARLRSTKGKYPKAVTLLVPRLRRVASRVEKLFWFGSHRFFMWLVEFTLFFSTVLLASSAASLVLETRRTGEAGGVDSLGVASISCSLAALVFVLVRISYVMKKYTFVLNNAGLVPEVLALQVIHNVRQKRQLMNRVYADAHDDASGSESDSEASEAARERRRKFSRFFANDAQTSGYIAGTSQGAAEGAGRFGKVGGKAVQRLRRRRVRAPSQDMPLVAVRGGPPALEEDSD
jgi:hypothetical protein